MGSVCRDSYVIIVKDTTIVRPTVLPRTMFKKKKNSKECAEAERKYINCVRLKKPESTPQGRTSDA